MNLLTSSLIREFFLKAIKKKSICLITHRDPFANDGGIEHCIRAEFQLAINASLNIIVVTPLAYDSSNKKHDSLIKIYLNGEYYKCFFESFCIAIKYIDLEFVAIHSLIGYDLRILRLLSAVKKTKIYFWVHDLSYVCESHVLIRNKKFCGIPSLNDSNCIQCNYYGSRHDLRRLVVSVLHYADKVIYPTEIARERFENYINHSRPRQVLPHYRTRCSTSLFSLSSEKIISPIGICFFGHNVSHKGWQLFLELVDALALTDRYRFFHVGSAHSIDFRVQHISFSEIDAEQPLDKLKNLCFTHNIRLAFFWSITLESFGLMLRQVLLTQCAVLANANDPALREFIDGSDKISYFNKFDDLLAFAKDQRAVDILLSKAASTVCLLKESNYSFAIHSEID